MLTLGRVSHQIVVARWNRDLTRTAQRPLPPAIGAAFAAGIHPETPQPVEPLRLAAVAVPRRQHGYRSPFGARVVRVGYDICAGSAGTKPFTAMTSRYQCADAFGVRACVS